MTTPLISRTLPSPLGELRLVSGTLGLRAVLWENDAPNRVPLGNISQAGDAPTLEAAVSQLTEYFAGQRTSFSLPLEFVGTEFQKAVWRELLAIPFGETRSYAQVARAIGRPNSCRAVGAAVGRNPLSLIAPCHRVIGSNGSLTGFAGGLKAKTFLLRLEADVRANGMR